jgi:pterin-4a-carbinolamine dehydratase
VEKAFTELIDKVALVDVANTRAVADIVLSGGGETIATDVPATTLLFLEKKITDMATFIAKLPVLDPSEVWSLDANDTKIFRTPPTESFRMKKVLRNHEKAPATDHHPAQVETYSEDVPVGTWTTIKFSGAIPADLKRRLAERCETLRQAVRYAREQANSVTVPDVEAIGPAVASYVFYDR